MFAVGQLFFNKQTNKQTHREIRFMVTRNRGWEEAGNEPGPRLQLNTSLLLPHFLNFCLRRYGCVCLIEHRSFEDENYLPVILTYPSLLEKIKKASDGDNSYGVMWTQFHDQKWQLSTLLMASSGPWLAYSLIYCNTSCTSQESKIPTSIVERKSRPDSCRHVFFIIFKAMLLLTPC